MFILWIISSICLLYKNHKFKYLGWMFHEYSGLLTLKYQTNKIRNLTRDQFVTHLDGFHGTDHQNSLHDAGSEPAEQAFGAVQSTRLVSRAVAEELKHPEPE